MPINLFRRKPKLSRREPEKPVGPFPRDMTKEEVDRLANGCLFCGSSEVYEGPSAGMSTNFICEGCKARYNLAPVAPPFGCQIIGGPGYG